MRNNKNIGKAVLLACLFATSLSSCSSFKNNKEVEKTEETQVKTSKNEKYEAKKTNIKKDKTTEVLVDAQVKKEDIVKVVKHGDHWHVFTKDGREKITYTDPNQMKDTSNFEMVSVVGKNQLKNKNVVAIKKHGDHYHVYLADGSEYLTYENPQALFPNIKIGTYVGSHGSHKASSTKAQRQIQNNKVKEKLEKDNERVIKILKHGDHYHIYTSKGNEFVTYEDPRSLYPNASFGIYQGSHGDRKNMIAKILKEDREKSRKNPRRNEEKADDLLIKDNKLIKVENEKKTHNVVKILKHGDHYHIYTADGSEYISYTDPSNLYPDIPIGTYVGSHGNKKSEKKGDGKEDQTNDTYPTNPTENRKSRIESLEITNILGKDKVDRYDIVKILKHGDHYHIYDSKGREGVTYENPQDIYPKANFGLYEGSHNHQGPDKKDIVWPEGITKIIDHGDHWHLYKGDKEVGVVTENPKSHYPNAEYINEAKDYSHVDVNDSDLFTYDSVEAKKVAGIERVFDDRFKQMEKYGQISDGKPAFGPGGQYKGGQVFYWLHGDHYHYLSIKDLVKMEKAGELGNFTAKDIVATLKYKMANPDEEIGKEYDDVNSEILRAHIIDLLKKTYPEADVQNIELNFNVHGPSDFTFHISDFEEVDGKLVYKKGMLPEMKKEEKPSEENSGEDKKENPQEGKTDSNKDKKDSETKEEKKEINPAEK